MFAFDDDLKACWSSYEGDEAQLWSARDFYIQREITMDTVMIW